MHDWVTRKEKDPSINLAPFFILSFKGKVLSIHTHDRHTYIIHISNVKHKYDLLPDL